MCIILYKPKNRKLPDKTILKNCFDNNNDGAGYMFVKNNQVYFKKGFTNFDTFYNELTKEYKSNNLDSKNLVLHFRIGTSGGINKEKTHPFIISDKDEKLNQLKGYCKSAIVHNGIFSNYVNDNKNLSDTQNFIKGFLYPLLKLSHFNFNNKDITKLINKQIETSKIIILDQKDNIFMYGNFIEDNGIYYSNTTYSYSYKKYYSTYYDNFKNWQLPFEENKKEKTKTPDKYKNNLKLIDGWHEAILMEDGYYFKPFDYIDSYKYYINDKGEIYEENNESKIKSLIGYGEIIKLY